MFIYPIYNHNWRNISTIYVYITRLASNEIFSPSDNIYREVGRAKDLSAPLRIFRLMLVLFYIYIYSTNIPPIMIINRIYEHQNLLSLWLVSFLVGLRTYQHPGILSGADQNCLLEYDVFTTGIQSKLLEIFCFYKNTYTSIHKEWHP